MKKFLYSLFLILFSIEIVNAKETILTCNYYKPYDELSGTKEVGILCDIYDNYTHQCYMEVGSGTATTKSNQEKILNWETSTGISWTAESYIKNNNKCPDYLLIRMDKAVNGYQIHAAPDMNSLFELQKNLDYQRYPATLGNWKAFDNVKKAEEALESYIYSIDDAINKYMQGECKNLNASLINLENCKNLLSDLQNKLNSWNQVIAGYISGGVIDTNNELYKKFKTAVERAEKFIKEEQEKIKEAEEEKTTEPEKEPSAPSKPDYEDIDDGNLSEICAKEGVRKSLRFLGRILFAVKIAVPALLIILGAIDFMKSITSSNQDALGKSIKNFVIRIIVGIVIFIIPTIVNYVFGLVGHGNTSYEQCRVCIFNPGDCAKGID